MSRETSEQVFRSLDRDIESRGPLQVDEILARIHERATPKQREFLSDDARLIAIRAGRRATKTYGLALLLTQEACKHKNAITYYITERRDRARELMWDSMATGLKKLDSDLGIGMEFHNTYLEARIPQTGGVIKLRGAETRSDIDKLRGEPGDAFVIDEARNFQPQRLVQLIDHVLVPSTADYGGRVVQASNPGTILSGTFYEATRPESSIARPFVLKDSWPEGQRWLWSTHSWTAKDNTAMPHIWDEFLRIKEMMGWSDENPIWRREYLGEWIVDGQDSVFRFDPEGNCYDPNPKTPYGLPESHEWKFLCGMDFGFVDDFALVVAATADTHPILYEVFSYSKPGMTIRDIAEVYRATETRFGRFDAVVGDTGGLGKQIVEELAREPHHILVEAADKTQKLTYVELMNSDLVDKRILVRRESPLRDEMRHLQWQDERKQKTAKGQKDHLCDAFVYLWRRALHHQGMQLRSKPAMGTKEWEEEYARAEKRKLVERLTRGKELDRSSNLDDRLDNPFGSVLGSSEWI